MRGLKTHQKRPDADPEKTDAVNIGFSPVQKWPVMACFYGLHIGSADK